MKYLFLFLTFLISPLFAEEKPAVSSHSKLSNAHYVVHSMAFGEGEEVQGRVFIERAGVIIATLEGVSAVSFSPDGKSLLLVEQVMDDDLRHIVLDLSKETFEKVAKEKIKRIGGRYVSDAVWSKDSRYLVLFSGFEIAPSPPEVIERAKSISRN